MRRLSRMTAVILALLMLLSITGCSSSADGKTHLTFQIWDVYQRPGMQAICDAYTKEHPDVRSEERRGGKESQLTCRSRWSPDH